MVRVRGGIRVGVRVRVRVGLGLGGRGRVPHRGERDGEYEEGVGDEAVPGVVRG